LVYLYSTIKMMHGPINLRFTNILYLIDEKPYYLIVVRQYYTTVFVLVCCAVFVAHLPVNASWYKTRNETIYCCCCCATVSTMNSLLLTYYYVNLISNREYIIFQKTVLHWWLCYRPLGMKAKQTNTYLIENLNKLNKPQKIFTRISRGL
jgi:hypothetical protein